MNLRLGVTVAVFTAAGCVCGPPAKVGDVEEALLSNQDVSGARVGRIRFSTVAECGADAGAFVFTLKGPLRTGTWQMPFGGDPARSSDGEATLAWCEAGRCRAPEASEWRVEFQALPAASDGGPQQNVGFTVTNVGLGSQTLGTATAGVWCGP